MQAGQTSFVVTLGSILNVEKVAALRGEIAAALESEQDLRVNFSAVEELDLSCLQVLYAALAAAKASGKELHFVGALSPRVSGRLKACGFIGEAFPQACDLETALGRLS
jgi:anti-anti-sigma regulatory factor